MQTAERDAVAVTALDGRDHLVPDYALAEHWRADGWYLAWCGTLVVSAAMTQPPGTPCDLCSCVALVARARARDRAARPTSRSDELTRTAADCARPDPVHGPRLLRSAQRGTTQRERAIWNLLRYGAGSDAADSRAARWVRTFRPSGRRRATR